MTFPPAGHLLQEMSFLTRKDTQSSVTQIRGNHSSPLSFNTFNSVYLLLLYD